MISIRDVVIAWVSLCIGASAAFAYAGNQLQSTFGDLTFTNNTEHAVVVHQISGQETLLEPGQTLHKRTGQVE